MMEYFRYILASVLAGVGTRTFIMTFTALIASVSHILIHPAILLERWPVLFLCMAVATAASLVSARFANRVDNRTVGRVTGVVLTVLGAALILLQYWELIAAQPLAMSVLWRVPAVHRPGGAVDAPLSSEVKTAPAFDGGNWLAAVCVG